MINFLNINAKYNKISSFVINKFKNNIEFKMFFFFFCLKMFLDIQKYQNVIKINIIFVALRYALLIQKVFTFS